MVQKSDLNLETPQEVMFQKLEYCQIETKISNFKWIFHRAFTDPIPIQIIQILYQNETYQV